MIYDGSCVLSDGFRKACVMSTFDHLQTRSTSRGRDVAAYTCLSVPQLLLGDHGGEPL